MYAYVNSKTHQATYDKRNNMPQITSKSVIATPARDGVGAFSIIAESRHIDLFATESDDKDIEQMDVHVQPEPDADFDLDW